MHEDGVTEQSAKQIELQRSLISEWRYRVASQENEVTDQADKRKWSYRVVVYENGVAE